MELSKRRNASATNQRKGIKDQVFEYRYQQLLQNPKRPLLEDSSQVKKGNYVLDSMILFHHFDNPFLQMDH